MVHDPRKEALYAEEPVPSDPLFLSHSVQALRRYRYPISFALGLFSILLIACLLLIYLLSPSQRVNSLAFRLDFEGADKGEYPNGVEFSSADIIASPILTQVYHQNDLKRFASFQEFANAVVVIESNETLALLSREYQAKLADSRLTTIDRERLEREFQLKRESLSKSEYAIEFIPSGGSKKIPETIVLKSLHDILNSWARSAADEKGVIKYRLPVLSKNVLDRNILASNDYIVALDILRTRIENIVRNIDTLAKVPGAEVLRTGSEQVSFEEIRLRLNDLIRFRIQPLLVRIRTSSGTPAPSATIRYLESQLLYNQRQANSAGEKSEAMRQAFALYMNQRPAPVSQPGSEDRALSERAGDMVMPQISDSFLDRLITVTQQSSDLEFRQKAVEEITLAELEVIPFHEEASYYDRLLAAMRGLQQQANPDSMIRAEVGAIHSEVESSIGHVNGLYNVLSRNLHPSTVLFTIRGPAISRIDRAVSLRRLALYGMLAFLLAIPLALAAALFHNRIRREEWLEEEWDSRNGAATSEPAQSLHADYSVRR